MTNYVYIAASLDGYIAESDGGIDWLNSIPNPEQSDYGFAEFIDNVDALVMGRNTFEVVLGFGQWPYTKKVFVLSNSLKGVPDDLTGKAEIINGDLKTVVDQLRERGYKNLYVDGGKVIQGFLQADLIDEMMITTVSILLGDGIPLFGKLAKSMKFSLTKSERLNDMLAKNYYTRIRE